MDHRTQWLIKAPLGLLLTGFGLSVIGDSTARKSRGEAWFGQGTLGLVLFNAGLSIFGDAVKSRVLLELGETKRDN